MAATFGINTMAVDPPDQFVELVKMADQAGFSHLFVADSSLHGHDVYAYLTLLALHSKSLRTAPLVTHPYTRHPAINLNALATINEIAGGRVAINIGAGDRPVMELGYDIAKAKAVREAITVIRKLQAEETVDFAGATWRLAQASLHFGRGKDMPLYVTATGPRMLELGGEVADGVFFHIGTDPRCVRYALDHIAIGARRSGRTLADLLLACCVYGVLDDDVERGRELGRVTAAWFPKTAPQYAELIGVPAERIEAIRQAYRGGHSHQAVEAHALVTPEMVDAFPMFGGPKHWLERLKPIEAMGVNLFVALLLPHRTSFTEKQSMYRRLATEVLPHFRG